MAAAAAAAASSPVVISDSEWTRIEKEAEAHAVRVTSRYDPREPVWGKFTTDNEWMDNFKMYIHAHYPTTYTAKKATSVYKGDDNSELDASAHIAMILNPHRPDASNSSEDHLLWMLIGSYAGTRLRALNLQIRQVNMGMNTDHDADPFDGAFEYVMRRIPVSMLLRIVARGRREQRSPTASAFYMRQTEALIGDIEEWLEPRHHLASSGVLDHFARGAKDGSRVAIGNDAARLLSQFAVHGPSIRINPARIDRAHAVAELAQLSAAVAQGMEPDALREQLKRLLDQIPDLDGNKKPK